MTPEKVTQSIDTKKNLDMKTQKESKQKESYVSLKKNLNNIYASEKKTDVQKKNADKELDSYLNKWNWTIKDNTTKFEQGERVAEEWWNAIDKNALSLMKSAAVKLQKDIEWSWDVNMKNRQERGNITIEREGLNNFVVWSYGNKTHIQFTNNTRLDFTPVLIGHKRHPLGTPSSTERWFDVTKLTYRISYAIKYANLVNMIMQTLETQEREYIKKDKHWNIVLPGKLNDTILVSNQVLSQLPFGSPITIYMKHVSVADALVEYINERQYAKNNPWSWLYKPNYTVDKNFLQYEYNDFDEYKYLSVAAEKYQNKIEWDEIIPNKENRLMRWDITVEKHNDTFTVWSYWLKTDLTISGYGNSNVFTIIWPWINLVMKSYHESWRWINAIPVLEMIDRIHQIIKTTDPNKKVEINNNWDLIEPSIVWSIWTKIFWWSTWATILMSHNQYKGGIQDQDLVAYINKRKKLKK